MTEIKIEMTDADFGRLNITAGQWQGEGWEDQADRFETLDSDVVEPSWEWKMRYTFGSNWANVLLARAYIEAAGSSFEVIRDVSDGADLSYMILTNFMTERHRKHFG
jgi:hypothetical protein